MAVVDKTKNKWIQDRDELQSIGFKLPIVLDNGSGALSKSTIDAVKNNLLCLLNTEAGERVMQPTLGVRLKRVLFQPFSEEIIIEIKDIIETSLNYWMPFVVINDIQVKMSDEQTHEGRSTIEVSINFSLKRDPNIDESILIIIGD